MRPDTVPPPFLTRELQDDDDEPQWVHVHLDEEYVGYVGLEGEEIHPFSSDAFALVARLAAVAGTRPTAAFVRRLINGFEMPVRVTWERPCWHMG